MENLFHLVFCRLQCLFFSFGMYGTMQLINQWGIFMWCSWFLFAILSLSEERLKAKCGNEIIHQELLEVIEWTALDGVVFKQLLIVIDFEESCRNIDNSCEANKHSIYHYRCYALKTNDFFLLCGWEKIQFVRYLTSIMINRRR